MKQSVFKDTVLREGAASRWNRKATDRLTQVEDFGIDDQ
jgi:hypothetical protein